MDVRNRRAFRTHADSIDHSTTLLMNRLCKARMQEILRVYSRLRNHFFFERDAILGARSFVLEVCNLDKVSVMERDTSSRQIPERFSRKIPDHGP